MSNKWVTWITAIALIAAVGCRTARPAKTGAETIAPATANVVTYDVPENIEPGKPALVEASHQARPAWTVQLSGREGNQYRFTGTVKNVQHYALGVRQAKAEAVKNLVETLAAEISSKLEQSLAGDNYNGEPIASLVRDRIDVIVREFGVSGIRPTELYYQKFLQMGPYGIETRYDISVLIEIEKRLHDLFSQKFLERLKRHESDTAVSAAATALLLSHDEARE